MRLRAIEPEDLELLYTIENDATNWWLGTQTAPLSRYHLREYIANNESDIFKDEQLRLIAEHEGRVVGIIDLFNFSPRHQRAELGVAILASEQGRGFAQMAIREIISYARDIVSLHQIYAIVPCRNLPSLRMLENVGFTSEMMLKDWVFIEGKYENAAVMQLFL